ncbi:MAG: hypothetical protein KGL31_05615 [candidate division NC10 bacterium]|nr:hypothetical protein [candidate division NC10 bacterium]MDE2321381.1 hypothetical protein [candidate division NC10 bacterium]
MTIVLVSHDLTLIQDTCRTVMWLRHGQIAASGLADKVVAEYQQFSASLSV